MIKINNGLIKFPLIFALSFLMLQSFAENEPAIYINWTESKKIVFSGKQVDVINFEDAFFHNSTLPQKVIRIKGEVESVDFSNITTEALTILENRLVGNYALGSPRTEIFYGIESNIVYSYLYIVPLIKAASGSVEKVKSFEYSYKFKSNSQFTTTQSVSGNQRVTNGKSTSSVLSSGDWYKLSVGSTGIYKIDYEFLKVMGISGNIDPRNIKIYGNGGQMLPQKNSTPRADDLVENAIFVDGESDGVFNEEDYILFFAQGPHTWAFNSKGNYFNHNYNLYSEQSYYFLTVGPGTGLRIESKETLSGGANASINTFTEYAFIEKDEVNILHSGREWFGDKFDYNTTSREYGFDISGLVPNTGVKLLTNVVAASSIASQFSLFANNQSLRTFSVPGISDIFSYTYSKKGELRLDTTTIPYNFINNTANLRVRLNYQSTSNASYAHVNYISINYLKHLSLYGNQTLFRSRASLGTTRVEYIISGLNSGVKIWDVTNPLKPVSQLFNLEGTNGKYITETNGLIKEFVAFAGNSFSKPQFVGKIRNQNLHGITGPVPQLLIITADQFSGAAERLAEHRRINDGMRVKVATISQVYNEFSSGRQDITAIRDFVKLVYDRSTTADSLKYVLLFGDCSYDYKDRLSDNTNFIPVYESRESLYPVSTYSSDDYYGFMDAPEGDWLEDDPLFHYMDLGVGRIPANNSAQADQLVNKIISYDLNVNARSKWRNRICFVADDGDGNLHQNDAEKLSNKVFSNNPVFNINKIYLDAYPQVTAPGGELAIEAKKLLIQEIEKGTLIVNYTGHGGESGWAQEKVLEQKDLQELKNINNLTFMVTATCEFGRYDDPKVPSGAEFAVWNTNGGVIGLMTTTRPVLSNSNFTINLALYSYMFHKKEGKWLKLGEILKETKNHSIEGVYNRNYSLLGDPSQTLAYPQETIKIISVNGKDPSIASDTLKALSKVTISGEVQSGNSILSDFNGTLNITVFDKSSEITTLGNEGSNMRFNLFNNFIYDGKASIKDGRFTVNFVVPKDISYQLDKGKISLYALKDNNKTDAHGYENKVVIGGSAENIASDNIPPQMKLYLNDESFVNGGVTGTNPKLIVKLFDENGINIAGTGIGHELSARLNEEKAIINLNDYYSATLDNYQEGIIEYPLKDLKSGEHILRVKAWDTHNNSNESSIEFIVLNQEKLELKNILNYPNPFTTNTNFHFDHNRRGDDLEILVHIYTVSGKLVKTIRDVQYSSKSHISDIRWDGRDDYGDKIGKGVYVYKIEIRSVNDGSKTHKFQKLVLLN